MKQGDFGPLSSTAAQGEFLRKEFNFDTKENINRNFRNSRSN